MLLRRHALLRLLCAAAVLAALAALGMASERPRGAVGKLETLVNLARDSPVIRLSAEQYKTLVVGSHMQYTVVVMFSTAEKSCALCQLVRPDFATAAEYVLQETAAHQYRPPMFFVEMLFQADTQEIFHKHAISSAPAIYYFGTRPAMGSDQSRINYTLSEDNQYPLMMHRSAAQIVEWATAKNGHRIVYQPPFYVRHAFKLTSLVAVLVVAAVFAANWSTVRVRLSSWRFWFTLTRWITTGLLAGGMYLYIAGAPAVAQNPYTGRVMLMAGMGQQFGTEWLAVFVIIFAGTTALLSLHTRIHTLEGEWLQRLGAVTLLVVLFVCYGAFAVLARFKNPSYMSGA